GRERHRRSARVVGRDPNGRWRQERVLLEAEAEERVGAEQNGENRDDDGDDGAADEELGHGSLAFALRRRGGRCRLRWSRRWRTRRWLSLAGRRRVVRGPCWRGLRLPSPAAPLV